VFGKLFAAFLSATCVAVDLDLKFFFRLLNAFYRIVDLIAVAKVDLQLIRVVDVAFALGTKHTLDQQLELKFFLFQLLMKLGVLFGQAITFGVGLLLLGIGLQLLSLKLLFVSFQLVDALVEKCHVCHDVDRSNS
jgi:hypothetical protein